MITDKQAIELWNKLKEIETRLDSLEHKKEKVEQ
tara:strand:+ start:849 stop:950 length:102 start_codon:yes stop_codon:yes gene_type:complete